MSTLADQVAEQRRRLKSVRMMLTTAVARTSQGDPQFAPFYVAIGDYMEAAMGGLHAQDVKMGRMIRHKLGTPDAAAEQALGELDQRLAGNQKFLQIMLAGREGLLTSQAPAALLAFEQAGHAYAHYIVSQMGHHGGTTELAARLFSPGDWEVMAGITEQDTRREQQLYARVLATLPAILQNLRSSA